MIDHSDVANAAAELLAQLKARRNTETQQAVLCDLLHTLGYEVPAVLSEEQVAAYMESGGSLCPYCRSENIEGGAIDVDSDHASQEVNCNACGAQWYDEYRLIGVVASAWPEPKEQAHE